MDRRGHFAFVRDLATRWDLIAAIVVFGLLIFAFEASHGLLEPLSRLNAEPLSLDPRNLPFYAARTTLRMFAGLFFSLIFTLTYATWAAKSPRAEKLLVPILDILQSVPILTFLSVTVVFFMSLAPGRVLGAEFAAIFAIFTSQAWNMAFSFYQSLRTVPYELTEAADTFHLTPWMRFWQLEVPFGLPALIWNVMMSMAGGWFSVVLSEFVTVGQTTFALPGIGSYIALATQQGNMRAIGYAIVTMFVVILVCDQLIFRPLVVWVDRFRVEQEPGTWLPESWALTMMRRSRLVAAVTTTFYTTVRWTSWALPRPKRVIPRLPRAVNRRLDTLWIGFLVLLLAWGGWKIGVALIAQTTWSEALHVIGLASLTMLRVIVLIVIASLIWVPIGIRVGLNPRAAEIVQPVAQFLASFPPQLLFPLAVYGIVTWKLNPDVWLSPLMILGTQWYILFNVIAGATAIPAELKYAAENFHVRKWLWWRRVALPAVLPYFVTGAITASGGSWNAAVLAELASWKTTTVEAHGIGSYIAKATAAGDFQKCILGAVVMCAFVVLINRVLWRPLYYYAERKFRLT
jgi:NitT/TauT family transport system permease protein